MKKSVFFFLEWCICDIAAGGFSHCKHEQALRKERERKEKAKEDKRMKKRGVKTDQSPKGGINDPSDGDTMKLCRKMGLNHVRSCSFVFISIYINYMLL